MYMYKIHFWGIVTVFSVFATVFFAVMAIVHMANAEILDGLGSLGGFLCYIFITKGAYKKFQEKYLDYVER